MFGCGPMSWDLIIERNPPAARCLFKHSKLGVVYNIFLSLLTAISHIILIENIWNTHSAFGFIFLTTATVVQLFTVTFIMITVCMH